MKTSLLEYELPVELIAQRPVGERSHSRMLVLDRKTGAVQDRFFHELGKYLKAGDCLVLNDTKVIPARFFAKRQSGGKLEGLFLGTQPNGSWEVMLKGLRKLAKGEQIILLDRDGEAFCEAELVEKMGDGKCVLAVSGTSACAAKPHTLEYPPCQSSKISRCFAARNDWCEGVKVKKCESAGPMPAVFTPSPLRGTPPSQRESFKILERIGVAPLPPYIKRICSDGADVERYQTVYAARPGAVAAPTAGLHFTKELLKELQDKGVEAARVTLHVGAGTFKPVTTGELEEHEIHSEWYEITADNAKKINEARRKGGRIIAVGTTSVRTLETAWADGAVQPGSGTTKLYILPGYAFKAVDAMVTNFHLPRSTLLALVGAFAGMENVMAAYRHAVEEKYRFFSYGDAMLIIGNRNRV